MIDQGDAVDDAFVHSPALARMVELARAQRLPPSNLDAARLAAAVRKRRSARNRNVVLTAVALAAGIAALWFGLDRHRLELDEEANRDAAAAVVDQGPREGDARVRETSATGVAVPRERDAIDPAPPVAVEPIDDVASPTEAAPPVEPAASDESPTAGVATPQPSASELARQAEDAMIDHRRKDAIELLTQLVRRYPSHAAARTALLDLGRLLREGGRADEARCAYRLFVARWPGDSTRADVDRALASLGDGPACRGLRPRR